jgi:hypothetical protein
LSGIRRIAASPHRRIAASPHRRIAVIRRTPFDKVVEAVVTLSC